MKSMVLEADALRVNLPGRAPLIFDPWRWEMNDSAKVIVIRGDNGCGKTTLLNILSGHIRPARGRVLMDGAQLSGRGPSWARRQGVIRGFQSPLLCSELTVWENIAVPLFRSPWQRALPFKPQIMAELVAAGLSECAERASDELSFGQRRMVELLRVKAQAKNEGAKLVLLDEPFGGLDDRRREAVAQIISSLGHHGIPTILVDHDWVAVGTPLNHIETACDIGTDGSIVLRVLSPPTLGGDANAR